MKVHRLGTKRPPPALPKMGMPVRGLKRPAPIKCKHERVVTYQTWSLCIPCGKHLLNEE